MNVCFFEGTSWVWKKKRVEKCKLGLHMKALQEVGSSPVLEEFLNF